MPQQPFIEVSRFSQEAPKDHAIFNQAPTDILATDELDYKPTPNSEMHYIPRVVPDHADVLETVEQVFEGMAVGKKLAI